MTRLLGVIGDPIAHSLSPLIHNGWYRDLGIGATYEAMQVAEGALPDALQTLSNKSAIGVNVTLPHKLAARALAATASQTVNRIGAANTLTIKADGAWHADNTDVPGFSKALRGLQGGQNLSGLRTVLLGAGGSARAVIYALQLDGAEVICLNRTEAKARKLVEELGGPNCKSGTLDQYTDYIQKADVVVNTTSTGYDDAYLPTGVGKNRLFYDISYGKTSAAQLSEAAANGWRTADGLNMLIAQAAESFQIWFGMAPDHEKAMKRCRSALRAIL